MLRPSAPWGVAELLQDVIGNHRNGCVALESTGEVGWDFPLTECLPYSELKSTWGVNG